MKTIYYTLITGASGGIGEALAYEAAKDGHNLILVARSKAKLDQLAKDIKSQHSVKAEVITSDLSNPGSALGLVAELRSKKLNVNVLINNAGFGDYGKFSESDLIKQQSMIALNITSLTELSHLLLPAMVKAKSGKVMNVGSIASFLPGPMMSVYFATKAYVLSFSQSLSEELRDSGVSVTCLCPGSTKTSFGQAASVSETHSTKTSDVTPEQVAEYGWKALKDGKPIALHGTGNNVSVFLTRFMPRKTIAKIVYKVQK